MDDSFLKELTDSERDRRAHRRVRLFGPVLVDDRRSWQRARVVNLSAGGVAVRANRALPRGTVVEVYFELPSAVAIETEAEIVRSDGLEMGLRFLHLSNPERDALASYVQAA